MADFLQGRPCELTPWLERLNPWGWEEYKLAWDGHPLENVVDPHHVFSRQFGDHRWNLVAARRVAHEFVQGTRVGRLVCVLRLEERGDFARETIRSAIGRDVCGLIANDLEDGIFTGRLYDEAAEFCRRHNV